MTRYRPPAFGERWRPTAQDCARLERAIELLIELLDAVDGHTDTVPFSKGSMRLHRTAEPDDPNQSPFVLGDHGVPQPWLGDGLPEIARRRQRAAVVRRR